MGAKVLKVNIRDIICTKEKIFAYVYDETITVSGRNKRKLYSIRRLESKVIQEGELEYTLSSKKIVAFYSQKLWFFNNRGHFFIAFQNYNLAENMKKSPSTFASAYMKINTAEESYQVKTTISVYYNPSNNAPYVVDQLNTDKTYTLEFLNTSKRKVIADLEKMVN